MILNHYSFDKDKHKAWMIGDSSKDMMGAKNAGILACQILALNDTSLEKKLELHKNRLVLEVKKKCRKLKL